MYTINFSAKSTTSSKNLSKKERKVLRKKAARERKAAETAERRQSAELREDQPPEAQETLKQRQINTCYVIFWRPLEGNRAY